MIFKGSKTIFPIFFLKIHSTRVAIILLTTTLLLLSAGCKGKPVDPSVPNIILITIDALRADHLSSYGYFRQTSPFIDSIARQSTVFTNAYSTSSWTAPSMASIFTAYYPRSHGVQHGVARGSNAVIYGQELLSRNFQTLAEVLKEAGYTTFGVSTNGHISRSTGFSQGFDYFSTHWFKKSPQPNNTVKKWLGKIQNASRYFLWIHYFDPHNPYAPRLPWYKTYVAQARSFSKWRGEVIANPKDYIDEIKKSLDALETLIDRYDSEINNCDYYLKKLFKLLSPDENTLVIITADHGEAFLDHGQLVHGDTLFEEEIRIPLIIKFPDNSKIIKTINKPVSNLHIFPTIIDIAGVEITQKMQGKSLMPLISGNSDKTPGHVYLELDWFNYWKAIRSENWKLMISGTDKRKRFLYDLHSDPYETQNLVDKHRERTISLEAILETWMNTNPEFKAPKIKVKIDKEHENKLRTLGYL